MVRRAIVTDVGQNQMWAAQYYGYDRPGSFITSGGLGTMGFGLPAAMGVKLGRPNEAVWAVVGDGGLQMNIQELATVVQERAAVKIAVLNNGYLGLVRQLQEFFHDGRYSGIDLWPDFVKIADAYGIPARRVGVRRGHRRRLRLGQRRRRTGAARVRGGARRKTCTRWCRQGSRWKR